MGIPLRTIATQRVIIITLLALALVLVAAILFLVIRLQQAPIYAFGFDRVRVRDSHTNTIVTESAVPINIQPMGTNNDDLHGSIASYWLPVFVENLYGVSSELDTDKRNLIRYVRPFLCPGTPAVTAVQDYLAQYNPIERSMHGHIVVSADELAPPRAPDEYHLTWTARSFDTANHLVGTQTAGALITIAWTTPTPVFQNIGGQEVIGGNPVGMCVSNIIPDRSQDPHAAPVP